MKVKRIHKITSLLAIIIFLAPFVMESYHGITSEPHNFCDAKDLHHLHENDTDCSVYHLQIHQNFLAPADDFSLVVIPEISDKLCYEYHSKSFSLTSYKPSRAPPFFNVS